MKHLLSTLFLIFQILHSNFAQDGKICYVDGFCRFGFLEAETPVLEDLNQNRIKSIFRFSRLYILDRQSGGVHQPVPNEPLLFVVHLLDRWQYLRTLRDLPRDRRRPQCSVHLWWKGRQNLISSLKQLINCRYLGLSERSLLLGRSPMSRRTNLPFAGRERRGVSSKLPGGTSLSMVSSK